MRTPEARTNVLGKDGWSRRGPSKLHDLAPHMRSMFIDESLSRITEQQLRNYEQPDILFAVESFLQDVATITIGREVHNAAPANVYKYWM